MSFLPPGLALAQVRPQAAAPGLPMLLPAVAPPAPVPGGGAALAYQTRQQWAGHDLAAADLRISSSYTDAQGLTYAYVQQLHAGIPVYNQVVTLVFKAGKLRHHAGSFVAERSFAGLSPTPALPAATAVTRAVAPLATARVTAVATSRLGGPEQRQAFALAGVSNRELATSLVWTLDAKQRPRLAWNVNVELRDSPDWLNIRIDAATGQKLDQDNWTVYEAAARRAAAPAAPGRAVRTVAGPTAVPQQRLVGPASVQAVTPASYRVVPFSGERPDVTAPRVDTNPWLRAGAGNAATTYGWHFDGTTDYLDTRGNNVWAYDDSLNQNMPGRFTASTGTGGSLVFNDVPDFSKAPTLGRNRRAATTNLFYWNNLLHDVMYQYGFTEAAGNFQTANQGRGGLGGDHVRAEAQDGKDINNANFATPPDGTNGRMQMYLFDAVTPTYYINVTAPAAVADNYTAVEGAFSANNRLTDLGPVSGQLALYTDAGSNPTTSLACVSYGGATPLTGKIAVLYRGTCNFTFKVKNAQLAGAVAAIVINNTAAAPTAMGGDDQSITIPAVMIAQADGDALVAQLAKGVQVTLPKAPPSPLRDGDYDNGIIAHEYGHGISTRLTGGGTNASCLRNAEQAGEGWSDFFALMMTTDWTTAQTTDGSKARGVGAYLFNQPVTAAGFRRYPYSTSLGVNPLTYADVAKNTEVHATGEIWCATLWDMTWNIIQQQGAIEPNLYNSASTGGNTVALNLVMQGLKLQPCSPGFLDGRDGILAADSLLYGGRYHCAIWSAFARRGMGYSARQGSSDSATDQTPAYDVPGVTLVKSRTPLVGDQLALNLTATCECATTQQPYTLTTQLPTDLVYLSSTGGGMLSGRSVTFRNLTFAAGQQRTFRISAQTATDKGCAVTLPINDDRDANQVGDFTAATTTGSPGWGPSTARAYSGRTAWQVADPTKVTDCTLTSAAFTAGSEAVLSFYQYYNIEPRYDGGMVAISVNNGAWVDAAPYFLQNGYNATFVSGTASAGQACFSGVTKQGFQRTLVDLSSFSGQSIRVQFRFQSDEANPYNTALEGWYLDDMQVLSGCGGNQLVQFTTKDGTVADTYSTPLFLLPSTTPAIAEFSPASAPAGTPITLAGINLGGTTELLLSGKPVAFTVTGSSSLTFTLPAGLPANPLVRLTTPTGTATSSAFTVLLQVRPSAPLANDRSAPAASSAVAALLSEPVAGLGLAVFSAQAGGRKAGATQLSAGQPSPSQLATFTSTGGSAYPNFRPGETVQVSVPTGTTSLGGVPLTSYGYQFTVATGRATGALGNPISYSVGNNVGKIAAGDVTGDGLLDLVTGSYVGGFYASVLPGLVNGSFGPPVNYLVSDEPAAIALGDLNGDGRLDIVMATDQGVSVLLAQAGGGFATHVDYATTNSSAALALADLNGDGRLDVAVSSSRSTLSVLLGQAGGTLAAATNYALPNSSSEVAAGDLNGDGLLDLVSASRFVSADGAVAVLLAQASGGFAAPVSYAVPASPYDLRLADMNGDNRLDVVTSSYSGGSNISVLLGQADGTLAPRTDYTTGLGESLGVAAGDLNGDGRPDLVVNNYTDKSVSVLLAQAAGGFAAAVTYPLGSSPRGVALVDVNGDKALDVVVTGESKAYVLLGASQEPTLAGSSLPAAGTGIPVTLTGTNLSGATKLTVGGVAATITANSATSLTFVVPAGVAAGAAPLVVTTPSGTATRDFLFLAAPGNALALDGQSNYLALPAATVASLQRDFTLEYWVRTTQVGPTGTAWWQGAGLLDGEVTGPTSDYGTSLLGSKVAFGVGSTTVAAEVTLTSQTSINDGRWHYVAATRTASTGAMQLYIDGQLEASGTGNTVPLTATPTLRLGSIQTGSQFVAGTFDELRLWNVARSAADIQAAYLGGPATPTAAGLVGYYSFDEGLPGGTNTGTTTLYDLTANARHVALAGNFALTGTASNWVESYALAVPAAVASTSRTSTSFQANWAAPVVGQVSSYLLDVATSSTFTGSVATYPVAAPATRYTVAGNLAAGTTYYYRVRAEKAGLAPQGQGASSPTVAVAPACLVQASAKAASASIGSSGTATIAATQVDNGSTTNCSPLALGLQKVVYGEVAENGQLTLTAPAGQVFTAITFASYGSPSGTAGTYAYGSCHSASSQQVVEAALLGKNSGTIAATNALFTEPCLNTAKKLVVVAAYSPGGPASQLSYTCAEAGTAYVLLTASAGGSGASAVAAVTISLPTATTATTWNGTVSTAWADCANWSFGKVPDASTDVLIRAGTSYLPTPPSGVVAMRSLTVNGNLITNSSTTLQLSGDLQFNGAATFNGPVALVGSSTQTVSGSSPVTFSDLTVSKPSGTVQLLRNISVSSSLTLSSGLLSTASYRVALGSSGTLSETETSYVLGNVAAIRPMSTGASQSFGGLGLTLTPATGSINPGSTAVVRTTGTILTGVGTSQSIKRYFDIQPSTNQGLNVAMTFNYFTHELNGIPTANLLLFKAEATTGPWVAMGTGRAGTNSLTQTGLRDFSVWTLGNTANPLPVQLVSFTAVALGPDRVRLNWATASELNSAYYDVERSVDGLTFAPVGRVAAAGTSATAHAYELSDAKLPLGARLLYYRLRQVDLDETSRYSSVQSIALAGGSTSLSIYPNPTRTSATLSGAAPSTSVRVLDTVGRLILQTTTDATGTAQLALPATTLAGMYLVQVGEQVVRLTVD